VHVVVTGAGGFSGSHIVSALLALGHDVTAMAGRRLGRLQERDRARLTVVTGDLCTELRLPRHADAIVHAAATSPGPGVTTLAMVQDNVVATQRLVRYAADAGVRTFIYLSSLSVYGHILDPIVSERTPIRDPDAYGISKYLGELMLREQTLLRSLSIRLPGILGPRSVRNWVTGVLQAAQADAEIAFYNPAHPFNNAVHVADLAAFIGNVIDTPDWNGHDVVTVGAAGSISVQRVIEILAEAVGSLSALQVKPAERLGYIISCERACTIYGYRPMEIERMLRTFAQENSVIAS